jgi:hypothetical protein
MISSTTVRKPQTTWQRALAQARKLEPAARQIGNSVMFDISSTSELDRFYHVQLSNNKFNLLQGASCECTGPKYLPCVHRMAALLTYVARLEEKLWKGCDVITQMEDFGTEPQPTIDRHTAIWLDLLDKYERASDLIRAIEQGMDISKVTERIVFAQPSPDINSQLAKAV